MPMEILLISNSLFQEIHIFFTIFIEKTNLIIWWSNSFQSEHLKRVPPVVYVVREQVQCVLQVTFISYLEEYLQRDHFITSHLMLKLIKLSRVAKSKELCSFNIMFQRRSFALILYDFSLTLLQFFVDSIIPKQSSSC